MINDRVTRAGILAVILWRLSIAGLRWVWTGQSGGAALFDQQGANVFDPRRGERASLTWEFGDPL